VEAVSWPEITGASEITAIAELVRPWLHVEDIRRPALRIDLPFGPYEFESVVIAADEMPATARGVRAALLARAEDALAALEPAGWHLSECPRMRFDGSLTPLVRTLAGELVKPAVQRAISLRVDFAVIRL